MGQGGVPIPSGMVKSINFTTILLDFLGDLDALDDLGDQKNK